MKKSNMAPLIYLLTFILVNVVYYFVMKKPLGLLQNIFIVLIIIRGLIMKK